ncbi:thioesterase II family protein [Niveispirillum sp. KHB5.9]|uniref:thioesterase II family protein n=1 Tax=Niveispirillum sp. KHB5.9 TaxID=3400269 RepID=UPI003A864365
MPWRRSAQARVTLVAFPHAGGTAAMARPWPDALPAWVDVLAVQYPGRETRIGEKSYTRAIPLVEAIAGALAPGLPGRVCFLGHSMGALLAFLTARHLAASGHRAPDHLIVAGRRSPHLPDPFEPAHALPQDQFLARLRRLNGTPAAVFDHAELLELLLPMLRADFAVNETYRHDDDSPAPCPVTALGGTRDPMARPDELEAWRALAPLGLTTRLFEGDHFFLRSAQAAVLAHVTDILSGLASRAG